MPRLVSALRFQDASAQNKAAWPSSDPALRTFREALANARTAPCDVCFIGDSITEGLYASANANRWIELVTQALQGTYNDPAIPGGRGYMSPHVSGMGGTLENWVYNGAVGQTSSGVEPNGWGLNGRYVTLDAAAESATLTFKGAQVLLYFTRGSGTGTCNVSVDGGAPTSVNTNDAALASGWLGYFGADGLDPAVDHTVSVTWSSGGLVILEGALILDRDLNAGVRMWDAGHAGTTADDVGLPGRLWSNYFAGGTLPELVVFCFGSNEITAGKTKAQFKTGLTTVVEKARAASAAPSHLILMLPAKASTTVALWQEYLDAALEVSVEEGCAYLDLSQRFPRPGDPTYGPLYNDGVHPNNAGHRAIADGVLGLLAPGVSLTPLSAPASILPNVQTFTANGTWTKPAGCTFVQVNMYAGGGGGGSGRRGAASSAHAGGGGGGGGGWSQGVFAATELGATETVVIGAGGAGGTAIAVDSTNGNTGTDGNPTYIGTNRRLSASGGKGGVGGTATTGALGSGGEGTTDGGQDGGVSGITAAGGSGVSVYAPTGGGAGGCLPTSNVPQNGGVGGRYGSTSIGGPTGGSAGVANGAAPGVGAAVGPGGLGTGGGGGGSSLTVPQTGGAAGGKGGGGGGGSASVNGVASGAGGAGTIGLMTVISW